MRTITLVGAIMLVGCGHEQSTSAAPTTTSNAPRPATDTPPAQSDAPSTCAFASLDALCAGFRDHHRSSGTGWVSDECAYTSRRTSNGAFAEVVVVGVHVGSEATGTPAVQLMLAARIGARWFPLWLFAGGERAPRFTWTLDADGAFVRSTKAAGDRVEHLAFGSRGGVPLIATNVSVAADDAAPAVGAPETWLSVCGFTPVVRAIARASAPTDEASLAAIARAQARLERGRFVDVAGARGAATPNAPRTVIEVFETSGSACGGGGCTTGIRTRTIEGSMPEEGMHYFRYEHGTQAGCHRDTLPEAGASTLLEVAPARPDASVGCGFSGFDGDARVTWVVTRVFVPAR